LKQLLQDILEAARELRRDARPFVRYLVEPEAHVYAFSIAANVLLAFWPFMLVINAFFRYTLKWPEAVDALYLGIQDYFAGNTGRFLTYNLEQLVWKARTMEWASLLLLLFVANGVFLPLEVALNRAWGVKENRSLVKNQFVSMGLIFACGGLAVLSAAFTGWQMKVWSGLLGQHESIFDLVARAIFKMAALPLTIAMLFLVYWKLPNTNVPWRLILPRAVIVGMVLEVLKWVNLAIWPWVFRKFEREFGVFVNSATILTWSFVAGLFVLAGAEWSARRARQEADAGPPVPTPAVNGDRMGAETSAPAG
jgi:YihY family inner membrane protein